jgi:transposase-like protein
MALSEKESVVRKSRFSEEKMVQILREADRTPIGEVAKQHGISEQTIYNWRRHFGSMDSADVKRLRELEQENARLKKMVADRDLEIDVMKEIAAKKWYARRLDASRSGLRYPGVRFLQEADDLLFRKPLLHVQPPYPGARL